MNNKMTYSVRIVAGLYRYAFHACMKKHDFGTHKT